jgi:hypothetical protein
VSNEAFVVTGADDVARRIGSLSRDVDDLRAYEDIAQRVAADARAFAPRRTGRLASSIIGTATPRGAGAHTSLVYAGPINYGWARRNIAASLFMQRAADSKGASSADELGADIQRRIDSNGLG